MKKNSYITLPEMANFCHKCEQHLGAGEYIYSVSAGEERIINVDRLEKIPNYYAYIDKKTDIVYPINFLYYRLYGQYNEIKTGLIMEKFMDIFEAWINIDDISAIEKSGVDNTNILFKSGQKINIKMRFNELIEFIRQGVEIYRGYEEEVLDVD